MSRDYFGNLPVAAGMGFARDVLLLDDCEGSFTWTPTGTGGDDVHEYLAAAAYAGTAGLHLKTRTTAAAEDDWLQVTKALSYPESGLLVLRAKIAMPAQANLKSVSLVLSEAAGTTCYLAQAKWTPGTPKVEYVDAAGDLIQIPALANKPLDTAFSTIELAIDCRAHQYLSLAINGLRADLAGLGLYNAGAETYRYSAVVLKIVASAGAPAELYASHIYVGENLEA